MGGKEAKYLISKFETPNEDNLKTLRTIKVQQFVQVLSGYY